MNDNIDAYVEGVYVQSQYDAATQTRNQTFYQSVKCSILFPDQQEEFKDFFCANTTSIEIEGGADSEFKGENQLNFQYIIHSCDTMNTIRTTYWGQPAISCNPYTETLNVID